MTEHAHGADAIIVGAGLAGLTAAYELIRAGKRVLILDQENRSSLGGQAFWSLGGLFMVDTPEQRRMGIRDSHELALQDWFGSAQFDRLADEDAWGEQWARAYVDFAAGEKRSYLHSLGLRSLPFVGWAERGDGRAGGHGNSVPRFHITWGTGPGVVELFSRPVLQAEKTGQVRFLFRHRVSELIVEGGAVVGVRGGVLEPFDGERGTASPRGEIGEFELRAPATILASGGIGHSFELMRRHWPAERLGRAPQHMLAGVPAHVDGQLLAAAEAAGAAVVNRDRLWAYTEGIRNWAPVWPEHGIRILPGPSSMWFDAHGRRLEGMSGVPGADSLGAMRKILTSGFDYSWMILTQSIADKEFVLSGSEQNPDMTNRDLAGMLRDRIGSGAPEAIQKFIDYGADFVTAGTVEELVAKMNRLARGPKLDAADIARQIVERDRQMHNPFTKDVQVMTIHNARRSRTDRLVRVAAPHRILDPAHGPLIGIRLNILSRKTLGGLQTNLDAQVVRPAVDAAGAGSGGHSPHDDSRADTGAGPAAAGHDDSRADRKAEAASPTHREQPNSVTVEGLYAVGEAAGFGGGGMHGYNSLEGTFLGGCIFSGRQAGRALAGLL